MEEKNLDLEKELEEEQDLPIDPRLAIQTSYGTIRNLIDAVVELVTNCDDSYKRLEQQGFSVNGEIKIRVRRLKYGKCEKIEVLDFAEGMDKDQLKKALKFAAETSGLEKGKSVRGFFGRGLKEAILALGEGEILTIKDNKLSKALIWKEGNRPKYRPPRESHIPSPEERKKIGITEGNGTLVKIGVTNEKIKCPDCKTLLRQISNHYVLRDINSSQNRKITLDFESPEKGLRQFNLHIIYEMPKGKEIISQTLKLPEFGDEIKLKIFESVEELETPYNNPYARAGLLIKTSGAILDNQLFKFQNEDAGKFFFGEVVWENLIERLRQGESLIDLNRVGIEWQHEICQILQTQIEKVLEPYIERKRDQLTTKPSAIVSEKINKLNRTMCSLLNRLAKEHFTDTPQGPEPGEQIEDLTVKPPYANIEVDKPRHFSVYAPLNILDFHSKDYKVIIESSNKLHIHVLDSEITLRPHSEMPTVYYGTFRIIGKKENEESVITCRLGNYEATANVRVATPGKIGKREKITGPKGGFFQGIEPDLSPNPIQRVRYDEHSKKILICVNFPSVKKYFDEKLNFFKDGSKPMYAELIGEAFCRFIARKDIEYGRITLIPGNEIDAFITAVNFAQKKYLETIHAAVSKREL